MIFTTNMLPLTVNINMHPGSAAGLWPGTGLKFNIMPE